MKLHPHDPLSKPLDLASMALGILTAPSIGGRDYEVACPICSAAGRIEIRVARGTVDDIGPLEMDCDCLDNPFVDAHKMRDFLTEKATEAALGGAR